MSYWPPPPSVIRVTISFEDPAYFAWTLHPVCWTNVFVHSGWTYPSHAIRSSSPSPGPIDVWGFILAVGGWPAPPPLGPAVPPPPPQAAPSSISVAQSAPNEDHLASLVRVCVMRPPPPPSVLLPPVSP